MKKIVKSVPTVYETIPEDELTNESLNRKIIVMRQRNCSGSVSYGMMMRVPFADQPAFWFVDISKPIYDFGNAWGYTEPTPLDLMKHWGFNNPGHSFFIFDNIREFAVWFANETAKP